MSSSQAYPYLSYASMLKGQPQQTHQPAISPPNPSQPSQGDPSHFLSQPPPFYYQYQPSPLVPPPFHQYPTSLPPPPPLPPSEPPSNPPSLSVPPPIHFIPNTAYQITTYPNSGVYPPLPNQFTPPQTSNPPPPAPLQKQPPPQLSQNSQLPSVAAQNGTRQWQADVYAPAFIPQFYLQINTYPATRIPSVPLPSIPYSSFISGFAGGSFLRPLPPYPDIPEPTEHPLSPSPRTYSHFFLNLLFLEKNSRQAAMTSYNLYNVPIYMYDVTKATYKLSVPGLRELIPPLKLGDIVQLRQIRLATNSGQYPPPPQGFTGYQYDAYVYGLDRQNGYLILRIDQLAMESGMFNVAFVVQERDFGPQARAVIDCARVLSKATPIASISSPLNDITNQVAIKSPISPPGLPHPPLSMSTPLRPIDEGNSYLRKILFPHKEDGVMQLTLGKGIFHHRWCDPELNWEQQKAIDAIIEQNYGTVPYLISGPPGTGKTKTIVEAALQLIFAPSARKNHILLCAPSNEAADTLAIRLTQHLSPRVLLRLNSPARTFAEVPNQLMTYSYVNNDSFGLPEWRKLMSYRVVVATCSDCALLVEARCTNRDLGRWARVVMGGIRGEELQGYKDGADVGEWDAGEKPTAEDESVALHWNALLIDEAAQGTEPEMAAALSVIIPPENCSNETPLFVMAGDYKQLGPRTYSRQHLYETSLFERLFLRPLYAEHPLSRKSYSKLGSSNSWEWNMKAQASLLPYLRPPFTNLIRNYRSHPAILAVPSALFYHDTLIPEAKGVEVLESWPEWRGKKWPVLFLNNGGNDEMVEEGPSFYNQREIKMACGVAKKLTDLAAVHPEQIAIMSPFKEQVRRIRHALRTAYNLPRVNVGALEFYQGSEYRFVIICTTRTRERFLEQDTAKGLGIIYEQKRFCVAMTRAKHGLVVIGNPVLLGRDPCWLAFLSFCHRHGLVELDPELDEIHITPLPPSSAEQARPAQGRSLVTVNAWKPPQDEIDTPQYLSRLEQGLVHKQRLLVLSSATMNNGSGSGRILSGGGGYEDDDPMWTAGITAEEALRDADA